MTTFILRSVVSLCLFSSFLIFTPAQAQEKKEKENKPVLEVGLTLRDHLRFRRDGKVADDGVSGADADSYFQNKIGVAGSLTVNLSQKIGVTSEWKTGAHGLNGWRTCGINTKEGGDICDIGGFNPRAFFVHGDFGNIVVRIGGMGPHYKDSAGASSHYDDTWDTNAWLDGAQVGVTDFKGTPFDGALKSAFFRIGHLDDLEEVNFFKRVDGSFDSLNYYELILNPRDWSKFVKQVKFIRWGIGSTAGNFVNLHHEFDLSGFTDFIDKLTIYHTHRFGGSEIPANLKNKGSFEGKIASSYAVKLQKQAGKHKFQFLFGRFPQNLGLFVEDRYEFNAQISPGSYGKVLVPGMVVFKHSVQVNPWLSFFTQPSYRFRGRDESSRLYPSQVQVRSGLKLSLNHRFLKRK